MKFIAIIRSTDDIEQPPAYVGPDRTDNKVVWSKEQAYQFDSEAAALLAAEDVMLPGEFGQVEVILQERQNNE